VTGGRIGRGDPVVVAASGARGTVARIVIDGGDRAEAGSGEAATLLLAEPVEAAPGDLLADPADRPDVADQLAAHVVWTGGEPLLPGRSYLMRIGERSLPATVTKIAHKLDLPSFEKLAARTLSAGDVGFCNLSLAAPAAFDAYERSRETGSFTLGDRSSGETVATGLIAFALRRATNIHMERLGVDKAMRGGLKGQRPCIVWFTGLPAAGKSTIARLVEVELHAAGHHTYMLDGDNLRHGLNRDIGFTDADRVENIRRVGEVAKLFVDAGLIVLCAFISPFRAERQMVRNLVAEGEFIEVFVDTSLEECMRRDPKGLYAKARAGQLKNFTGFDSAYEPPAAPDLRLRTAQESAKALAGRVIDHLRTSGRLAAALE
jgi:bifunctional enzyme CysN/CysC